MSVFKNLKHHFVPTEENKGTPHLFKSEILALFLFLIVIFQVITFTGIVTVVFKSVPDMVASVLPTILALETNQYRTENKVTSLAMNPLLTQAAELKAKDMAERGYFSHISPEGNKPWVWFDKVGYSYSYAGENLAINFTDSEDVTHAWITSKAHRENLVNSNFTETGIGTAEGMYENKPTTFVVQFFGSPTDVAEKPVIVPTQIKHIAKAKAPQVVAIGATTTGEVLGLYTDSPKKEFPVYSPAVASPRHLLHTITLYVALLFVLLLVISYMHTAYSHTNSQLFSKLSHSYRVHKTLMVKILVFILLISLLWVLDFYVFSKQVTIDGGISKETRI